MECRILEIVERWEAADLTTMPGKRTTTTRQLQDIVDEWADPKNELNGFQAMTRIQGLAAMGAIRDISNLDEPITPGDFYDLVIAEVEEEFGKELMKEKILPHLSFSYFPNTSHCNFFVSNVDWADHSVAGELIHSLDCHIANVKNMAVDLITFIKASNVFQLGETK